jgi:hypothetical protein
LALRNVTAKTHESGLNVSLAAGLNSTDIYTTPARSKTAGSDGAMPESEHQEDIERRLQYLSSSR